MLRAAVVTTLMVSSAGSALFPALVWPQDWLVELSGYYQVAPVPYTSSCLGMWVGSLAALLSCSLVFREQGRIASYDALRQNHVGHSMAKRAAGPAADWCCWIHQRLHGYEGYDVYDGYDHGSDSTDRSGLTF
jgi:hypothetical protein